MVTTPNPNHAEFVFEQYFNLTSWLDSIDTISKMCVFGTPLSTNFVMLSATIHCRRKQWKLENSMSLHASHL